MTTKTALQEISDLTARIEALKQQAVSEIAAKIAEKKTELRELESEYEQLTGKTVRGDKSQKEAGTRTRLTHEEKAALPGRLADALAGGELSLGQIVEAIGEGVPKSAIKKVLSDAKLFKMTGSRASARYSKK
jgi:predicted RNase H-like nuclease (RuvC/YqgF family)